MLHSNNTVPSLVIIGHDPKLKLIRSLICSLKYRIQNMPALQLKEIVANMHKTHSTLTELGRAIRPQAACLLTQNNLEQVF